MSSAGQEARSVWRQVAVVVDGKDLPVGRATLLTVTPDGYEVTVNGRFYQRGTSRTDSEQTPRQSDVVVAEGPNAGETLEQIFKVEGDVLVACIGGPGVARPTEFTSTPGSGHTLSVWLRVGPGAVPGGVSAVGWWVILGVSLWIGSGIAAALCKDLDPLVGYWWALAVRSVMTGAFGGLVALLISGAWKLDRGSQLILGGYGLTFGVLISVTLGTFDGVRAATARALGVGGAQAAGAGTALVVGLAIGTVFVRLLKLSGSDRGAG